MAAASAAVAAAALPVGSGSGSGSRAVHSRTDGLTTRCASSCPPEVALCAFLPLTAAATHVGSAQERSRA